MVYHIPGTEIGKCDFQAVQGRFLIESGTFDDTPMGNKALEYLLSNKESFQVSIGYKYIQGDEEDGTYDWLRFRERSICPEGTAANPWTEFQIFGGKEMDDQHKATLTKIFGEELANEVVSKADSKTKELEDGNVRFKADPKTSEVDGETFIKQLAKSLGVDESKALEEAKKIAASVSEESKSEEKEDKKEEEKGEPDPIPTPAFDNTKLTEMAQLIADMAEQVDGLTQTVKELKEAKGEDWTPRINMKTLVPTEDNKNLIDDAKAKEITGNSSDQDVNPAAAYVQDLLMAGGRVPANN
jgi:hypothetical protein